MSKYHSVTRSFGYAIQGIKSAILNEPNFRIHCVIAILALVLGLVLKLTPNEWVVLFFTIAFVLILELVNTAMEALVDMVSPEIQPKAKIAKDVTAGAVLISAILSVLIGIVIFLPKILRLIYA